MLLHFLIFNLLCSSSEMLTWATFFYLVCVHIKEPSFMWLDFSAEIYKLKFLMNGAASEI